MSSNSEEIDYKIVYEDWKNKNESLEEPNDLVERELKKLSKIEPIENIMKNLIGLHVHLIKKIKRDSLREQTISLLVFLLKKVAEKSPNMVANQLKDLIDLYESFLNDLKESSAIKFEEKYRYRIFLCSACLSYLNLTNRKITVEEFNNQNDKTVNHLFELLMIIIEEQNWQNKIRIDEVKGLIVKYHLIFSEKNTGDEYLKKFFENIDKLMKTQVSIKNERLLIVYGDVVLTFLRLSKIPNYQISLIICNEVTDLFKNNVMDKLYNELINCNFEIDNLNNADLIKQLAPIIHKLYSACFELENLDDITRLSIQYNKAIVFCYQKNYDSALKHLNESLSKVSSSSYFADRFGRLIDKVLIEKSKEKLKKKYNIDMSYIPASTLKIAQRSSNSSSRRSSVCSPDGPEHGSSKQKRHAKYKYYNKKEDIQQPMIVKSSKPVCSKIKAPVAVSSYTKETIYIPSPVSIPKPTNNEKKNWELKAYCAKCTEKCEKEIIELYKCDVHGILNKRIDLRFQAKFINSNILKSIRKYPNSRTHRYNSCKKFQDKGCDSQDCDSAHSDLEKFVWNYMLEKNMKHLYEIIKLVNSTKPNSNSLAEIESEIKSQEKVVLPMTKDKTSEMPDEKFNFKNKFYNYCRICNKRFENNKNAFLHHRLHKSHLELQRLIRRFQFTRRMPPDILKLKKEMLIMCPELQNNCCKFQSMYPRDNICLYPHNQLEIKDWTYWFEYYNEEKLKEMDKNTFKLSDFLIVNRLPKLKEVFFYYSNEKYEKNWHLQSNDLNELNYEALMHGMIYNEMMTFVKLVEETSWLCTMEKLDPENDLLFKIKLTAKLTKKEHPFYKDKHLIEYVNILRIENDLVGDTTDLVIDEKFFNRSNSEEDVEINLTAKANNKKEDDSFSILSNLKTKIKSKMIIDRSMFYSMHFAVDNVNKAFLFPRIECSNTNIEEALDSDYEFAKHITPEQKKIIQRIIKHKNSILTSPIAIYGAFGSGKTYCIREAARILALKNENSKTKKLKVLICTSSESASNIYFGKWDPETCKKAIKLVRNKRLVPKNENNYETICIVPLTQKDVIEKISEASIVVCTFYTSILLNEDPRIAEWITHILIDEATQTFECETIMPLTLALSNTTVLLAGDHRQILPLIYSKENYMFFRQNLSLLQRLFAYYSKVEETLSESIKIDIDDFKLILKTIHRTVGEIVDFVSHNFYNGTLKSNRRSIEITDPSIKYFPMQFIDGNESSSCEEYDAMHSSYFNEVEGRAICWYAEMLIEYWPTNWSDISIGLVSSEVAQIELLREYCQNSIILKKYHEKNNIQIDLVQNFQGCQFRVVLISSVRTKPLQSNSNENLLYSLLINPYSINTCLTRSEELIVVFGNRKFLENVPELFSHYSMSFMWRNFISLCIANNGYHKINLCSDKLKDSFYFENLKNYLDKLKKPLQKSKLVEAFQGTYLYKQNIKDSILDTILIGKEYMNDDSSNRNNFENNYSDDDEDNLPITRRPKQPITKIIPYKNLKYDQENSKQKQKRKTYSQDDVLDSDEENFNILDDDMEVERLEKYMSMDDDDENDDINNRDSAFLKRKAPYYEALIKKEAEERLEKQPEKYKKCKIRFENNNFSAIAHSIDNENESYYIRDRCNCGMAYNGDTVVCEILDDVTVNTSLFNSKQTRATVVCVCKRNEKFRNREFICLPDEYEPCLMHKPLDTMYPKIYIYGTYESRIKNKITIYNVDVNNQIKTSKNYEIKMQDLEANMFKVRIVKWNSFDKFPIGLVTEVLNSANTIEDGIRCLKLQYDINDTDVSDELYHESYDNYLHRRLDFSDMLTFTIDPVDSHDFDDALSFERIVYENQTYYKIGIHIADVGEYVKKDSKIDIEAEKRTASCYYSINDDHKQIPMLPRVLATAHCSLKPNESKKCMSVMFIMNQIGEVLSANHILSTNFQGKYLITKSTIESKYRFTYEEVEFYLNDIKKHEKSDELKIFYDLSQKLKYKRYEEGQFFIEETSFDKLDFNGELVAHEAHSLIEEFMILTNSIVAEFLCENYDFVPLRIQKVPDINLLTDWFERHKNLQSVSFGISRYITCLQDSVKISKNNKSVVNMKSMPVIKTVFNRITEVISNLNNFNEDEDKIKMLMKKLKILICNEHSYPLIANAINEVRKILDPAEYVCVNSKNNKANFKHFSVNVKSYTHFTSPIRRYIDLIVHRMVDAALNRQNTSSFPYGKGYLQEICRKSSIKAKNQRDFIRRIKELSITELLKKCPIECISFIHSIEERQFNVIYPYFNNIRTKKCSKISYSYLNLSKQPRTGSVIQKSSRNIQYDDDGLETKYFETIDMEFSKRIYDIQAKSDILKLIDDTEHESIVKINLDNLYLNQFQIEHWNQIRALIKKNSYFDLADYLRRIRFNKVNEENQSKTFLDVSSEVIGRNFKLEMQNSDQIMCKKKVIKHFNRRFTKNYKCGDVLKMQMSYSTDRGFLAPTIQLISVTNTIDYCVQHRVDPVKSFIYKTIKPIIKLKTSYSNFDEYLNTWLPIMSMEAATTAILEPEDVAFIRNVKIDWRKEETRHPITKQYSDEIIFGKLELDKKYCDERHLKFCEDSENDLVLKMKDMPRGHPTFALSYLCVQYKNIQMKESQKEIFSNKTGNLLMNDTYTWVGHCVVTKVIDEETRARNNKDLKNNELYKYKIYIALIQADIDMPNSLFGNSSLECTIELISKQYPDSAMEFSLRNLQDQEYHVSKLAQSIILGTKKPKLDQRELIGDDEIQSFIKNCIEKSKDKIQRPNDKQFAAIKSAFKHPFSLIQGPPGTGKTVTGIVLAICFTQLNRKSLGEDNNRLMYCSPSNKAVDVIGRFLRNRFFLDKSKNKQSIDFSFVRVYSERIASSDYPHPKYFDKIISSSPKLGENHIKQTNSKRNTSADNNHSDPDLVEFVLHHIIRKDGKKYAEELKKYDRKFSILREYEDRVRNRRCCCASDRSKFKIYNHRICKHARYFYHVNKDFSMHSMLRGVDKPFSTELEDYDLKFYFLKLYLKRRYDQIEELSEIEKTIFKPHAVHHFNLTENDAISKQMYQILIEKMFPPLHQNISVYEVGSFLNSLTVDLSLDRFYKMMGLDKKVRNARQNKVAKAVLDNAYENAYFKFMKQAAKFTWDLANEFEEIVLKAELNLFEKEMQTTLDSNDTESYHKKLHEAYKLELQEHDIILCTCIATSTLDLSEIGNFKQLIIDEAGMTKEPEALVPILLCKPEKVVLIGDHAQLRPVIKSQQARDLGLDQSLFERYCHNITMLEEQYRMHESICYFPSKTFYYSRLITKTQNQSAILWPGKYLMDIKDHPKNEMRIVFIDVKGIESKLAVHSNEGSENSVRNNQEIDCVDQIYKYLAEDTTKINFIESKDIVILSQYRAQVAGIKSRLKITNENNVLTVITSQGGEWDYVILSTVRSLPDCDIDSKPTDGWRRKYLGFISDQNQVNVALTRAKKGLIIIGNKNLLKCDPIWRDFLYYLESKNSIMTIEKYFEFQKIL